MWKRLSSEKKTFFRLITIAILVRILLMPFFFNIDVDNTKLIKSEIVKIL